MRWLWAKRLGCCKRVALNSNAITDRYQQFLSTLGSMRLAGAEPSPEVVELGMGWVRGELDADDLAYAAEQAAAGVPFTGRPAAGKPE
jgi:hypothetical protein